MSSTGLGPGEVHCFAVQAKGPEGVESSPLSPFDCATTEQTPQLQAPFNFVATKLGAASFDVAWEYPGPIDGLTFTVFANNDPVKADIAGLFTTVDVPQREVTHEVRLTVRAVSGEQMSNGSNEQLVVVDALTAATTTSTATTTVPGGPGATTVPGGPGGPSATTVAPSTTSAPTTTAPPTPAQSALQDLDKTWVSVIGAVVPDPAGTGEAAQRASLAATFDVAPEQILKFSNRDTVARDAADAPIPTITAGSPDDEFFYVAQPDEGAAITFCAGDIRCDPMTLQGAGKAAVGTEVLIVDRLDPNALLDVLDDRLQTLRTGLRPSGDPRPRRRSTAAVRHQPDPRRRRRLRQPAGAQRLLHRQRHHPLRSRRHPGLISRRLRSGHAELRREVRNAVRLDTFEQPIEPAVSAELGLDRVARR